MWDRDQKREFIEQLANLPDRIAQAFERGRTGEGGGPARPQVPAVSALDPRQMMRLQVETFRLGQQQLVADRLSLRATITATRELGNFTSALRAATRTLHDAGRGGSTDRPAGPSGPPQAPPRPPVSAPPPLTMPSRQTVTRSPGLIAQTGTQFTAHALARHFVPSSLKMPSAPPGPPPPSAGPTPSSMPAPDPRPVPLVAPPPAVADPSGQSGSGIPAPPRPRVRRVRGRAASPQTGQLSVEGLGGSEPVRAPSSDFSFPSGAVSSPAGDQFGRVAGMLSELMQRFGQTNTQLGEVMATLHQRFPDKVPASEMPRTGTMKPGADPAKDAPEKGEQLGGAIDRLTAAVESLRVNFGQKVPVLAGGGSGGGGGGHAAPPGPSPAGAAGPPLDRGYLQKLLDSAPQPSAGTRAAFLKRMDVRRMIGLTVRPRDVEALSGLIDTGHGMQEGLLSRAQGAVGKGRFTQDMVDTLRHLWGVGGAARPADLMQQVFGRLIGAAKGKTAVTADMIRDMALSGASPSAPFDFAKLYRRFKGGQPPSPKQLREMAGVFGFEGMLPPEWFPKGRRLPGSPTAPGFVGPVQPALVPQPGDPSAAGFVGPRAQPHVGRMLAAMRERVGKRMVSDDFLREVRTILAGHEKAGAVLKRLEGLKGSRVTKSMTDDIAKLLGLDLSGGGSPSGGRLGMPTLAGLINRFGIPLAATGGKLFGSLRDASLATALSRVLPGKTGEAVAVTAAAGGMRMVAGAAAAAAYALTKLPHDIHARAGRQLESLRELSGIHGGMASVFIGSDMASLKHDRQYADRVLATTRTLAAATSDLEGKLVESRAMWTNLSNLTWSTLAGAGSGLAEAFSPVASTVNDIVGGEGDWFARASQRLTRAWGKGAMSAFGVGTGGIPTGPFAGLVAAYDLLFGPAASMGKLSPDNPWSRYLLEVSGKPLRPSRPVP